MFSQHSIFFVGLSPHTQTLIHQYGGSIVRDIESANCIIVSQTYQLSKEEQDLLSKRALIGVPVYTDQYIIDAVHYNGNIDANQYQIQFVSSSGDSTSLQSNPSHTSNSDSPQGVVSSIEMKGSREVDFSNDLPKILYTLTWKHKYDIRVKAQTNVFTQKSDELRKNIYMCLVFGSSYVIPHYEGNGRSGKKGAETIVVSSLQKVSDSEIIIRFGIHSTYCSKRFAYEPFRLCLHFAGDSSSEPFAIYTSEFKTFVKKNANINKYLEGTTMDNSVKIVTESHNPDNLPIKPNQKASSATSVTTDANTKPASESSAGSKKRKRKTVTTTKKSKKKKIETDTSGAGAQPVVFPQSSPLSALSNQPSDMSYNLDSTSLQSNGLVPPVPMNVMDNSNVPPIRWFGEPIGMNVNGDLFYLAFWKNGEIYKVNDFVYLCPDVQNYSDIHWICKIINLVQTTSGEMKLVGQWYYKWCDVEGIVQDKSVIQLKHDLQGVSPKNQVIHEMHNKHSSNEVFASFDMTYNPLSQIKSKCYVSWMDHLEENWLKKPDHYFFFLGFNRTTRQLIELDEQTVRELSASTNDDREADPMQLQQELLTLQSEIKGHKHKYDDSIPQHIHSNHLVRRPSWEGSRLTADVYLNPNSYNSNSGTFPNFPSHPPSSYPPKDMPSTEF